MEPTVLEIVELVIDVAGLIIAVIGLCLEIKENSDGNDSKGK